MKTSTALLGLGALALVVGAGRSAGRSAGAAQSLFASDDDPPESEGWAEYEYGEEVDYDYTLLPDAVDENHAYLRYYLEEAGLHPYWIVFFEAMAANESNFKEWVGLGKPELYPEGTVPSQNHPEWRKENEHQAAIRAYERNIERYEDCGYAPERYTFGSGGWFALLPANGLRAFDGTDLQCLDPYSVFDPAASVVMAIEMVRRLMRWSGWKKAPTFANLRAGLKNPAEMGDPEAIHQIVHKTKGLLYRYNQIGANPALIDMTPPPLPPKNPVALFNKLNAL